MIMSGGRGRSAFLDRLQGGATEVAGGQVELQRPPVAMEEDRKDWQTHSQTSRPQDTFTSLEPDPEHSTSDWREETSKTHTDARTHWVPLITMCQ